MREIKFRVWDNVEKAYLNEKDIAIDSLGNIFIIEGYDHNDSELWYARILPDPDNKRHVIEQCTGLKDKNGREIYQGDIVSVRDSPVAIEDEKGVCFVDWSSVLAGFLLKGSDAYKFDEQSLSDLKLIVIGNIHEDYELLEEKQS
jgi:uncharacterized phage protein (TIGR01671 family)